MLSTRTQTSSISSPQTARDQNDLAGRVADLPCSTMRLVGHQDPVMGCDFHPDGEILLSASKDSQIRLWSTFGNRRTMMTLEGHTRGINEARFSKDGEQIFSCSKDATLGVWDTFTGVRLRKLVGHNSCVNSVSITKMGLSTLCSGSEDGIVRLWDERIRDSIRIITTGFAIKSTSFDITEQQVFYAGEDGRFTRWDLRKNEDIDRLKGHTDTITGISLAPQGEHMASFCRDNTIKIWDLGRRCFGDGCKRTLRGIENSDENSLFRCAWSKDNGRIAAGSSDGHIYIWDASNLQLLYKFRVPKGSATGVDFHPTQTLIAAASSDRSLYILETNDLSSNNNEN